MRNVNQQKRRYLLVKTVCTKKLSQNIQYRLKLLKLLKSDTTDYIVRS